MTLPDLYKLKNLLNKYAVLASKTGRPLVAAVTDQVAAEVASDTSLLERRDEQREREDKV